MAYLLDAKNEFIDLQFYALGATIGMVLELSSRSRSTYSKLAPKQKIMPRTQLLTSRQLHQAGTLRSFFAANDHRSRCATFYLVALFFFCWLCSFGFNEKTKRVVFMDIK
jgi:UMF1 family MFS transporter